MRYIGIGVQGEGSLERRRRRRGWRGSVKKGAADPTRATGSEPRARIEPADHTHGRAAGVGDASMRQTKITKPREDSSSAPLTSHRTSAALNARECSVRDDDQVARFLLASTDEKWSPREFLLASVYASVRGRGGEEKKAKERERERSGSAIVIYWNRLRCGSPVQQLFNSIVVVAPGFKQFNGLWYTRQLAVLNLECSAGAINFERDERLIPSYKLGFSHC